MEKAKENKNEFLCKQEGLFILTAICEGERGKKSQMQAFYGNCGLVEITSFLLFKWIMFPNTDYFLI